MADYSIKDIYQGGYSSLSPKYGDVFTNYRINPRTLGMTTDPRTADVLKDASSKLNVGAKHIEISAVNPAVFESIPNQQLHELNRLSKLTGVEMSVHGPIVEPSGLTEHGFSDAQREAAEKQMLSAVERGHKVNPHGNIPITFHSSAAPISGEIPTKGKEQEEVMIVNTDSGSIHKLPLKERYYPGEEGKRDIKTELNKLNERQWTESLEQLKYHSSMGKDAIDSSMITKVISDAEKKAGKELSKNEDVMRREFNRGSLFLNSSYNELTELFNTAWQKGSDAEKHKIENFYKEIDGKARKIKELQKEDPKSNEGVILRKEIIDQGVELLSKEILPPQIYKNLNEYAKEKTVETFSNVALKAFTDKNIGNRDVNKTPIISIENPPAGVIFSRGEDLRDIVDKSREKFVEKAIKDGISEKEAKAAAEKLIGVTWDVGHINMMRKLGYEKEDIIQQTEKIAPVVKHIHLSDNFGFEHTELPMGMGNVPIKEILGKLGKEGFDAKKIIEAGNWWEHFKTSPFKETLEAFGSPIYSMNMAPYWNQNLGLQQDYYPGLAGQWLPQTNYETFGTGFARLPTELGGQRGGGEGNRMSGRPME